MYSSRCGKLDAATIVSGYIDAGYSGLIVTDHFNRVTFDVKNIDIFSNVDKAACFLEGYYKIKEEGEKESRCGVAAPQRPRLSIHLTSILQANSILRDNAVDVKKRKSL